jgi:hypothetical protein
MMTGAHTPFELNAVPLGHRQSASVELYVLPAGQLIVPADDTHLLL